MQLIQKLGITNNQKNRRILKLSNRQNFVEKEIKSKGNIKLDKKKNRKEKPGEGTEPIQ